MSILGLDPSSRRIGWCVGSGHDAPEVGALLIEQFGVDLGGLAEKVDNWLQVMCVEHGVRHVVYEAPILTPHDRLLPLRKLYGVGWQIERVARLMGASCSEATVRQVKKELAGKAGAEKVDMVAAALKCGIKLPLTIAAGREDAADAFGVWLIGMRDHGRHHQQRWDKLLYGARGALL